MKSCGLVLALLWAHGAVARPQQGEKTSLAGSHPALHPVSDSKFYDGSRADYVTDERPHKDAPLHFNHPYPEVQDSHDYDKDYVKDENGDSGEFAAQEKYDHLRQHIVDQMKELERLKALQKAAHDALAAHKAAAGAVHEKVPDVPPAGDLSTKEVEIEINDLDKCKEQLRIAREKLQKAIVERKAALDAYEKAKAEHEAAKLKAKAAKAEEVKLEGEVKEEDHEHNTAYADFQEKDATLKKMEAELEAAAKALRKFRDADGSASTKGQDGGVYRESGAMSSTPTLAAAVVTIVAYLQLS